MRISGNVMLFLEGDVLAAAPLRADEVDAAVVRDAKEPRFEARRILQRRDVIEGLGEHLLDDVLAVECGAAHARAEAVEPRTGVCRGGDELLARLEDGVADGWAEVGRAFPCWCHI